MRSILVAIFGLSSLASVCSQTNDWPKRIVSKKHRPLASFINPHVSTVNVLIIDGKRFEHVRGVEKFYLPVPKTNAIVFVVDEKDYSVTYHVFKMDTGEDISIHARGSVFGQSIGFSKPEDAVEGVKGGKIVLATRYGPPTVILTIVQLDLTKKAVVGQKTLFYDQAR